MLKLHTDNYIIKDKSKYKSKYHKFVDRKLFAKVNFLNKNCIFGAIHVRVS